MPIGRTLGVVAVLAGCACTLPDAATATPFASVPAAAAAKRVVVVRGSGNIRPAVNSFRRLLGRNNGGEPGEHAVGRRELNWDGVPDELAAPHALPGDFFNASSAPRARGAVLSTTGDHVAVSADASNPDGAPVRFGDVNPGYPSQFKTFSAERLFSPIGSNVVDLRSGSQAARARRSYAASAPSTPTSTAARRRRFATTTRATG